MTTARFLISVKEGVEDGAGARSKGRLWTLRSKGASSGRFGGDLEEPGRAGQHAMGPEG